MLEKEDSETLEKILEDLEGRFLDLNGDAVPLEAIIEGILRGDKNPKGRRYATG